MSQSIDFELIDIPIEFKEINPSDFDSRYYSVEEKIVIEPNDEGYISESLLPILNKGLDEKNTVVINAGVGQGKSKAIIEMAEKYTKTGEHIVIIAVPYKNLIEQYVADCSFFADYETLNFLKIEDEAKNIFRFTEIDAINNRKFPISTYKVHVLTVNGLLGNSGEDSLFQARVKVTYFKELQDYCIKHKKKLVIIFDEIHDSVHNFKEDLIVNLWNFQGLIHKIITVSATYNEASKEVIKYLSELTGRKIQIIESKRTVVLEKQSKLKIYFYSGMFIERDKQLLDVLGSCLKNPESIDIMAYSKNLVKKFLSKPNSLSKSKEVNSLLYPHRELTNRCYADIFDHRANQKFHPNKINVGTNFTTGINIKKSEHNYVVILPKETNIEYFNNKGIFTNGASSVIQTLARQRLPGTIHLFMPQPALLEKASLKTTPEKQEKIIKVFKECGKNSIQKITYTNINQEKTESLNAYSSLLRNRTTAIELIANTERTGMNRLEFYPFELFNLYKAERHLTKKFFGGNLSAFVLWGALCKQFLNCQLDSITINPRLDLKASSLSQDIQAIYKDELLKLDDFGLFRQVEGNYNIPTGFHHDQLAISIAKSLSPYELWEYFQVHFLNAYDLYVDNERVSDSHYLNRIRLILLGIICMENPNADKKELYNHLLKSNIYFSNSIDFSNVPQNIIPHSELKEIELFKHWFEFMKLLEKLKEKNKRGDRLPNTPPKEFIDLFDSKFMMKNIEEISSVSSLLNSNMFPFKDTFGKIKTSKKMAATFYTLLLKVLYNGELTSSTKESKAIRFYKLEEIDFENSNLTNLLHKPLPEVIL